jgi:drug/metabolite transporter (DMT)-like permease
LIYYYEIIFASLLWGTSGVFVKYLNMPAESLAFIRLSIPVVVLSLWFVYTKNNCFQRHSVTLYAISLINALRIYLYLLAYSLTTIGNAIVALYTWPIFMFILGVIFLKEKMTCVRAFLIMMAFSGLLLIYGRQEFDWNDNDVIGISVMLVAAFLSALMMILLKTEHQVNGVESVFFQNLLGSVIFFPLFLSVDLPSVQQVSIASVYAFLIGVVAFSLFLNGLRQVQASTASVITYIEAVSGITFGVVFFNEQLTWNLVLGAVLILGACVGLVYQYEQPS